jgi:hypothetical protein
MCALEDRACVLVHAHNANTPRSDLPYPWLAAKENAYNDCSHDTVLHHGVSAFANVRECVWRGLGARARSPSTCACCAWMHASCHLQPTAAAPARHTPLANTAVKGGAHPHAAAGDDARGLHSQVRAARQGRSGGRQMLAGRVVVRRTRPWPCVARAHTHSVTPSSSQHALTRVRMQRDHWRV